MSHNFFSLFFIKNDEILFVSPDIQLVEEKLGNLSLPKDGISIRLPVCVLWIVTCLL